MKLEVTFPKLHRAPFFFNERNHYEPKTFTYDCDPENEKSGLENMDAAYEEALRRGHNPNKNIRIRDLPDRNGEPCPCCNEPMKKTSTT